MFRKIILAVVVLAVLVSVGLVFAQEEAVVGKERQMRRGQARRLEQDRPVDRPGRRGMGPMAQERGALAAGLDRWLGELTEAYRLKDDERMGQLLRRMNQVRQKVQQRGQRFGPGEKGFREGQGRMRRGKAAQGGPRATRMERFVPPMGGRDSAARPRRGGGGKMMGRRQGGAIGRAGRGMGGGGRSQAGAMGRLERGMGRGGQGFGQGERRMLRLREHADERFHGMDRRRAGRDIRRGFMPPKGPRW
jgi:hypothetical protein